MQKEGCISLYRMEKLSIIGLSEALSKIFQVLSIRRGMVEYFINNPPDIFIGIDVPDFNLVLEEKLKQQNIPTVHYVSPTVWAWRSYRIKRIRRAVDHMLTLFPFEAEYYKNENIPVTFVGHPLAEIIDEKQDREAMRRRLGLPENKTIIALLPGSRSSELYRHSTLLINTVSWLLKRRTDLHFVVPFINRKMRKIFNRFINKNEAWDLPITQLDGNAREAMSASDLVLLASGTATLEASLLSRVMVVTYKVSFVTSLLARFFLNVRLYSLPNNLAGKELVPELVQSDATPEKLGTAVIDLLSDPGRMAAIEKELGKIHKQLKKNANERAAQTVYDILKDRGIVMDPVVAEGG